MESEVKQAAWFPALNEYFDMVANHEQFWNAGHMGSTGIILNQTHLLFIFCSIKDVSDPFVKT